MIHVILLLFVTVACITDIRHSIIPNKLTLCGSIVGVFFHFASEGWKGLLIALVGAAVGFIALILLYFFGALGAGDVKLFAAIGAIMGVTFVVQSMLYAILCAGLIGLFLLVIKRQMAATGHKLALWLYGAIACHDMSSLQALKHQKNTKFPFMYAVVPGVGLTWCYTFL
ncbi:prepilin peptidase [Paenibacillus alba]|uniref:A24 family peptidase n=1 Tax=Paenibacillus alba TaxID=1197127 RepID=UPI0015650E43|nr:A24 family peptidase [Paenibacillus alba]NQX64668.1 prepilin peptidase [Paenibacillus alba]